MFFPSVKGPGNWSPKWLLVLDFAKALEPGCVWTLLSRIWKGNRRAFFFFWLLQQTNTYFSISVCQALVRVGIINNISQYLSSESLHSRRRGRIQPNSIYCDACCQKNMNQAFWVHSAVVFVGKNQGGKKQRRWHLICTLMSKVASQGSKECFRTSSIYSFYKYVLNVDYVPAQGCQGLSDEVNGHDPCPCSRVGEQANK